MLNIVSNPCATFVPLFSDRNNDNTTTLYSGWIRKYSPSYQLSSLVALRATRDESWYSGEYFLIHPSSGGSIVTLLPWSLNKLEGNIFQYYPPILPCRVILILGRSEFMVWNILTKAFLKNHTFWTLLSCHLPKNPSILEYWNVKINLPNIDVLGPFFVGSRV